MKPRDQAEFKLKLSRNVRRLREKQNLSQERLSEYAFVSLQFIKQLEDGLDVINHTVFPLLRVAKYFGVTLDELLFGNVEMDENVKLFYKIKSLTPTHRILIENFVMHN